MKKGELCLGCSIGNTQRWINKNGLKNIKIKDPKVYENRWRTEHIID